MSDTSTSAVNHRRIWQLAWPMIISNLTIPLVGIVDTAVVGHLEHAHYIGAVAVGSLIFAFLFWGFGFLRMATTGLTAQAVGASDTSAQIQALSHAIMLALVIASLLLIFQPFIAEIAFYLMAASPDVSSAAKSYFDIRIWSAPAVLVNYVLIGWLIGLGLTRSVLLIVVGINVTNIVFSVLLVYGFGLAVDGVAMASVIAEYFGLSLALIYLFRQPMTLHYIQQYWQWIPDWQLIKLHSDIFIRTLCLLFCFAFFTAQGARQGDTILAANAVLLHFLTLMAFFLDGFANAVEVMTGQAIGAKSWQNLVKAIKLTTVWAFIVAIAISLIYYGFGHVIILLMTDLPDIIAGAEQYMIWLIIAPLIGVWSYLLDGIFIGATRSREMRNTMLFSSFICYLPAWYFLQGLDNHGLWLALLIFLFARAISLGYYLPKVMHI